MVKMRTVFVYTSALLIGLLLISCGIGGSDDGYAGDSEGDPAQVKLNVSPNAIDSGDHMYLDLVISELTVKNIAVKIRVPVGLSYVLDSSTLTVGDTILDASPEENVVVDSYVYLVYYLDQDDFLPDGEGVLSLSLEGDADVSSGKVEVDIDYDDQGIDNDEEFESEQPQFDAQVEEDIRVGNGTDSVSSSGSSKGTSSSSASKSSTSSSSKSSSSSSK